MLLFENVLFYPATPQGSDTLLEMNPCRRKDLTIFYAARNERQCDDTGYF